MAMSAAAAAAADEEPVPPGLVLRLPPSTEYPYSEATYAAAESDKFDLLTAEEITAMPLVERSDYKQALLDFQVRYRLEPGGPYDVVVRAEQRCEHLIDELSGERCRRDKWDSSPKCLAHSSLDEIDPQGAAMSRRAKATARTAALAEKAIDRLEEILDADSEEVAPAIRLKAISEVLDRGGVPRHTANSAQVEIKADVKTTSASASEIINARLDALMSNELDGIAAASNQPVIEAPQPPSSADTRKDLTTEEPEFDD